MVVIRLSRGGSKHRPFYNIVVADKRVRRDGRSIARRGYNTRAAPAGEATRRAALDRRTYGRGGGAQASPPVAPRLKPAPAAATAQA